MCTFSTFTCFVLQKEVKICVSQRIKFLLSPQTGYWQLLFFFTNLIENTCYHTVLTAHVCLCFKCKWYYASLHTLIHTAGCSASRSQAPGSAIRDGSQALSLNSSLGTGKLLCFCTPSFPYIENKDNINLHGIFVRIIWEKLHKQLEQCLPHNKCLLKCISYLMANHSSAFHALFPKWWFLNEYMNKSF